MKPKQSHVGPDGKLSHGPHCLGGDWYCMVDGRSFGPWPDKGSCQAGYETEQRRARDRKADATLKLLSEYTTDELQTAIRHAYSVEALELIRQEIERRKQQT